MEFDPSSVDINVKNPEVEFLNLTRNIKLSNYRKNDKYLGNNLL